MGDYAQAYPQEELAQYPDFMADWQKVQQRRAVESSSMWEEAKTGFGRGVLGLESSGAGALSLLSGAVGAKGAEEFWRDIYKRKTQQMEEETPASVPTVQQAFTGGPRALGQWVSGKAGELVPNIGEALGFAAAGSAVAPGPGTEAGAASFFVRGAARSWLKKQIEGKLSKAELGVLEKFSAGEIGGDVLAKEAPEAFKLASKLSGMRGATAASAANFAALGAGGAYPALSEREGVTKAGAMGGAAIAGLGASAGALIPVQILEGIFGVGSGAAARSYVEKWTRKVPAPLLTAGGGMGAMEFFNILGERYADPKLRDKEWGKEEVQSDAECGCNRHPRGHSFYNDGWSEGHRSS